jgi:hypothetical protein
MSDLENKYEDFRTISSGGSMNSPLSRSLQGFNITKTPEMGIPKSNKMQGLVFMTRPQLNMNTHNLMTQAYYHPLLSIRESSLHRYVRCTLDPYLAVGFDGNGSGYPKTPIASPLVDKYQAFIPLATNSLELMTGWPEIVVPTKTTEPGAYGFTYTQVDGVVAINGTYDLTLTFSSRQADPLLRLFSYWSRYSTDVFSGALLPYRCMIRRNEIDYNTGIYRILLDKNGKKLTDIAYVAKGTIATDPTGKIFDFDKNKVYIDNGETFQIVVKAEGIYYNEPFIIDNFNEVVRIFNNAMEDGLREQYMRLLVDSEKVTMNYAAYPRINVDTHEFEWWVWKSDYDLAFKISKPAPPPSPLPKSLADVSMAERLRALNPNGV